MYNIATQTGWLPTLPQGLEASLGRYALLAAFAGTAAGGVLWLAGSRFSRSITTLVAVSLGGYLGMHVPGWMGWSFEPMAAAVVGAMVVGLSGYLMHTTWVGLSLSLVLALWAAVIAWVLSGGGATPYVPDVSWSAGMVEALRATWRALPGDLPRVMPIALAAALTAGVAITVLWPKLGRVLTYSIIGVSLLLVMGLSAMRMSRPDWLAALPATLPAQLAFVAGLVGLGVVTQWRLTPGVTGGNCASDSAGGGKPQ